MGKFFTLALAIAMSVGTTAALVKYYPPGARNPGALLVNDAAYRDGLYTGKLAAQSLKQRHIPVGRWSAEKDRASFKAGYNRGYEQFMAQQK